MSTSMDSSQINELAASVADRLFIQVGSWNLYLGDAGLAKDLAMECQVTLNKVQMLQLEKVLKRFK